MFCIKRMLSSTRCLFPTTTRSAHREHAHGCVGGSKERFHVGKPGIDQDFAHALALHVVRCGVEAATGELASSKLKRLLLVHWQRWILLPLSRMWPLLESVGRRRCLEICMGAVLAAACSTAGPTRRLCCYDQVSFLSRTKEVLLTQGSSDPPLFPLGALAPT